jgi:protease I
MKNDLTGKRVAILVADGFEQVELTKPKKALEKAGAETDIVSPSGDKVQGWEHDEMGDEFEVDVPLNEAKASDYDALLLPGGVMNPDTLRTIPAAVEFAKHFFEEGKPVAAICHGPQLLIEADVVKGRKMTSFPSLKTDLKNAGANWVDKEVVTDGQFISSRKPDDIPAFDRTLIDMLAKAKREKAA